MTVALNSLHTEYGVSLAARCDNITREKQAEGHCKTQGELVPRIDNFGPSFPPCFSPISDHYREKLIRWILSCQDSQSGGFCREPSTLASEKCKLTLIF